MKTRFFAVWALFLALWPAFSRAADAKKPNVVVIFTDDQGYGDVGCFGAQGYKTPHLDRMAREGRKFTNFHVAQPVCSASRVALLTGCYPSRVGIQGALGPNNKIGLSDGETTLAELFKAQGYATGMAGKWHLGDKPQFLPTRHGFDEFYGLPYSHDMWPFHPENPKAYPALPLFENETVVNAEVKPQDAAQITTDYTKRAVGFIDRNAGKPFFFYLAHSLPHVPLFVSEKYKGKSKNGLYGDVIEEIDWSVGQVFAALKRNNLDKNTLVIFTSDNGPWTSYGNHSGSAGPLREAKGTCWEGGVRVPCIMRWPGQIPAKSVSNSMLMTIDLLPTLANLIGAPLPPKPIDGLDVWPLISGALGAKNPHEAYYYYYLNNQLQAVTSGDGRWKLLLPHTYRTLAGRPGGQDGQPVRYEQAKIEAPQLYDLENDIAESRDLAAQHPEIVAQLQSFAEKARAEYGDSLAQRKGAGVRAAGGAG